MDKAERDKLRTSNRLFAPSAGEVDRLLDALDERERCEGELAALVDVLRPRLDVADRREAELVALLEEVRFFAAQCLPVAVDLHIRIDAALAGRGGAG
jgi:hypothetical protein